MNAILTSDAKFEALENRIAKAAVAAFEKGGRHDARFATLRARLVKMSGHDDHIIGLSAKLDNFLSRERDERDGCCCCGGEADATSRYDAIGRLCCIDCYNA